MYGRTPNSEGILFVYFWLLILNAYSTHFANIFKNFQSYTVKGTVLREFYFNWDCGGLDWVQLICRNHF